MSLVVLRTWSKETWYGFVAGLGLALLVYFIPLWLVSIGLQGAYWFGFSYVVLLVLMSFTYRRIFVRLYSMYGDSSRFRFFSGLVQGLVLGLLLVVLGLMLLVVFRVISSLAARFL